MLTFRYLSAARATRPTEFTSVRWYIYQGRIVAATARAVRESEPLRGASIKWYDEVYAKVCHKVDVAQSPDVCFEALQDACGTDHVHIPS